MKILFLHKPVYGSKWPNDFVADCLFHGLREKFGDSVVDFDCMWYMYSKFKTSRAFKRLWGKGFTLYGMFDGHDKIDRDDVNSKIRAKYFDLIVFGVIDKIDEEELRVVTENYDKSKIVFIDGADDTNIRTKYLDLGFYFKRECLKESLRKGVFPITMGIPVSKFVEPDISSKQKFFSSVIPGVKSTNVFTNEGSYFREYNSSFFAVTKKKSGWDCLRHYEILASGCVPYFENLDVCPVFTLWNFPKNVCMDVLNVENTKEIPDSFDKELYSEMLFFLSKYSKENLTTRCVADYLIKVVYGK